MSLEISSFVRFGRSRRFAAVIEGTAAIWELGISIDGAPHSLSGMVINLVTVDSWLEAAEKELVSSGEWRRAVMLTKSKLSNLPRSLVRGEMSLDDGIERRIAVLI